MISINKEKRKVLIISFLFPPANTMGAVRINKFAKYLPQFGWDPIVLTVIKVKGLPQTLPAEIDEKKIIRTHYITLAPFISEKLINSNSRTSNEKIKIIFSCREMIHKYLRKLQPIYTRPELRILTLENEGWYPYAIKNGLKLIKKCKFDVLFSSSPPVISHYVASKLCSKTGIPWVADLRDPWIDPYAGKIMWFYERLKKKMEKKVLKKSNSLVTVSEYFAQQLKVSHSKDISVIYNGFDEEDYLIDQVSITPKFTISYTGNIYPGKRDPSPLFEAVKELYQEGKVTSETFEIRFWGTNVTDFLPPLVEKYDLQKLVKIYNSITFKESIRKQKESTVLLSLGWDDPRDEGFYPGKIFEYIGAMKPILALGFKGGVVDNLLQKTGCGIMVSRTNECKEVLIKWLSEFEANNTIISYFNPNLKIIKDYSRREQTKKLAELFDQVANKHI